MKAILIDVINEEVKEVNYDDNIDTIYKHLKCSLFDVVHIGDKDTLYVDDEGLLNINEDSKFFVLFNSDLMQPIAGNGLILGSNFENGESIDTSFSVEYIRSIVKFFKYKNNTNLV
jgi:hypothetical protein